MTDSERLQELIDNSKIIVFFGGAGVSCESGIPDFRSADGLYNQKYKLPPEVMLSHSFYKQHTEYFFEFYRDKMIYKDAMPNKAHLKLAELERKKDVTVVTQNIDGLHQKAGSHNVLELHGSVLRNYCEKCHTFYDLDYILSSDGVPVCEKCGGVVKPDVVLYEESLDNDIVSRSVKAIESADLMIIGGTSLVVYPAAGLVNYFRGESLVVINKEHSNIMHKNVLEINMPIGSVFSQIIV